MDNDNNLTPQLESEPNTGTDELKEYEDFEPETFHGNFFTYLNTDRGYEMLRGIGSFVEKYSRELEPTVANYFQTLIDAKTTSAKYDFVK